MKTIKLLQEAYPPLLKQINRPPPYLYLAGSELPTTQFKYLCVIGARKYSEYGEEVCRTLIAGIKGWPIIIVSGLAYGIDSIAHQAALDNGLKTISFPGSGLDESVLYPAHHLNLAQNIIDAGGTLLSPFEMLQPGINWTFPARNRLMAGISHATLIIEGKKGSGTLLTADYALEFNRDVLIVPGSIFSELSYGPHLLYKRGAIPITTSEEILEVLGFETDSELKIETQSFDWSKIELTSNQAPIVRALQFKPQTFSELIELTAMASSQLTVCISELELAGYVTQISDRYKLVAKL